MIGDVRDRAILGPATAGAEIVVSAVHGFAGVQGNSPATVDRDGNANLIDATRAAGASFILVSTVGAAADSPMELFRMKQAAEDHAGAGGIPTTIIRATAFLELWIDLLQQTAARSGRPLVFGRGDNPINFVSVGDVAALVERAVTDPTTRGKTLEIGGPDNLTFNQLAEAVQTAESRTGTPRHVPPAMLRLMANTVGRVKPLLGRQARAALAMDRVEFTFDATPLHRTFPDLPNTRLSEVLATLANV
jgi:NADH dehydrogenase